MNSVVAIIYLVAAKLIITITSKTYATAIKHPLYLKRGCPSKLLKLNKHI